MFCPRPSDSSSATRWPLQDIVSLLVDCARVNRPFIFRPACIAHSVAILLHDYWAIYDPAPASPLLYFIYNTLLLITISCKGQATRCRTIRSTVSKKNANYRVPTSSCFPPRHPIGRPFGTSHSSPTFPHLAISSSRVDPNPAFINRETLPGKIPVES